MSTLIYTPKENGDLKLQAEIDEDMNDAEAVKLLLEESPRLRSDSFIVMIGDLEDAVVSTVRQQETVQVAWVSTRNGEVAAVEDDEEEAEAEAPAPRRRRQSTNGRRKSAAKTGSARRPGRPPGSKNKTGAGRKSGSPFKRNPASDD
jgi:hypothetical protein